MLQKILVLAANPKSTLPLSLDEEIREIDESLRRSRERGNFSLEKRLAVRTDDLRRSLLDEEPRFVHFCGHGEGEAGIVLEDGSGKPQMVSARVLANLFKSFSAQVECVILNACYTDIQAKAIQEHINYVIGMKQAIGDRAAIKFATGFYDAIGAGRSIEDAFEIGKNAIELDGIPEELTPTLLRKKDLSANIFIGSDAISALVSKVRLKYYQELRNKWKILDRSFAFDKPLEIKDIYVDVYILKPPTRDIYLEISDLLKDRDFLRDLDRFGLTEREERTSGIQAVIDIQKMMIYGKPGSGKTTFLRYIAFECIEESFLSDYIPILVFLRNIDSKSIENQEFDIKNQIFQTLRRFSKTEVQTLLDAGKILLILDGLDEVSSGNREKLIASIENFAEKYCNQEVNNRLIVSSRIQVQEYRIKDFNRDVEIADFNSEQIQQFAKNYFIAMDDSETSLAEEKANSFFDLLNLPENQPIRELAVTPILLSLVCVMFKDRKKNELPVNPARLYQQGIEKLLQTWDESKGLKRRETMYKALNIDSKESLLKYIAFEKSKKQKDFALFDKQEILKHICEHLSLSKEEARDILNVMIEQHGLIVERADGIYSFSHLTFQEYFTALKVVDDQDWESLISRITWGHWQEVFRLAFNLADPCDDLVWELKNHIDSMIARDSMIQEFLKWVHDKAMSAPTSPYKISVIRLFYFIRAFNIDFARVLGRWENLRIDQALEKDLNFDRCFALAQEFNYTKEIRDSDLSFGIEVGRFIHYAKYLEPEFSKDIQQFRDNFPNVENKDIFRQEWEVNGKLWNHQLKQVMNSSLYPKKDLFNNEQVELLRQYYKRNELLVKCLSNGCRVSDETRVRIECSLLLPLVELK